MYYGVIAWIVWHLYWDWHAPKPRSLKLFRWLHNWIAYRRGAIIMTSLDVTLGFFSVFARVLDIATALGTTLTFILLETLWVAGIFIKNKITRRRMVVSRLPTPLLYFNYLVVGMLSSGFFFSVMNYGATQLTFIIVMVPTAIFCIIAYKIFQKVNPQKKHLSAEDVYHIPRGSGIIHKFRRQGGTS